MVKLSAKVDYLTLTSKGEIVIDLPEMKPKYLQGMMHYDSRVETELYVHHTGQQGEMLVLSGSKLDSIRREMGLSDLEILKRVTAEKCTRIDFAVDVFESNLTAIGLETLWVQGQLKTKTKQGTLIRDTKGIRGDTFYLGSLETRQKLFRGYEKSKKEQDFLDRFRLELQLGKEGGAIQAHKALLSVDDTAPYIVGSLRSFLSPVKGTEMDSILSAEQVKAVVGRKEDSNTQKWLLGMVTESIIKESYKDPEFFSKFMDNLLLKMSSKEDKGLEF